MYNGCNCNSDGTCIKTLPYITYPFEVMTVSPLSVKIKRLTDTTTVPTKATDGSAAYDVYANAAGNVNSGETLKVSLGFALEIPSGYVALMCSRSGLALKNNVNVANSPGVIDSDYRGEVCALMHMGGVGRNYHFNKGDRIAQIVFVKSEEVSFEDVTELSSTDRAAGGFGSTGS